MGVVLILVFEVEHCQLTVSIVFIRLLQKLKPHGCHHWLRKTVPPYHNTEGNQGLGQYITGMPPHQKQCAQVHNGAFTSDFDTIDQSTET